MVAMFGIRPAGCRRVPGYVRALEGILGQLSALEGVPGQPSGVGDSIEDEVRIEGDTFQAFIALLAKRARLLSDETSPPHSVMAAYVRPVLPRRS